MNFVDFKDMCMETGDILAEDGIRCFYGDGYDIDGKCFSMYVGFNDGTELKVRMGEKQNKVWLMVFRNSTVKGKYNHESFADEYLNDFDTVIQRIYDHADLHGGINPKYKLRIY
jgi:hypothetical protein